MPKNTFLVKKYILMIATVCFCFALYCGCFVGVPEYANIWMLPFSLGVMILFMGRVIDQTIHMMSFKIVYSVEFLRYVIIPFFMVFNNFYHSDWYTIPSENACRLAVILMCYELIIECMMICFISKRIYSFKNKFVSVSNRQFYYKGTMIVKVLCYFIIAAVLALCVLRRYQLRISIFMFTVPGESHVLIIGEQLVSCALLLLYFSYSLPVLREIRQYGINTNRILKFFSLSLLWVGIGFGDARMTYIIKAFCILYILSLYVEGSTAGLSRAILIVAGVSVVAMTLLDENATHGIFYFTADAEYKSKYAYTLQKYFSGPYNIAKAIDVKESGVIGGITDRIQQFFVDIFYNVYPFSMNSDVKTTAYYFNHELYGRDFTVSSQIVPLIGQGYIYFGFILSVLPTCLLLGLLGSIEVGIYRRRQDDSVMTLFLTYASIFIAFFRMYNSIIIGGTLFNIFLICWIICKVQEKFFSKSL